ncbi:MAG: undecaprenyl/decaprenyl-phosphate alpha-N-acetylglucosaminyl 1-phosphate transferase [Fibrobacterota bacterium]|nr:undecaprenyl/decaprenyl-phosphate alpha-N-acetylglucosaminyl 1-phosphate transferase [Fibrobacterota bacterium]
MFLLLILLTSFLVCAVCLQLLMWSPIAKYFGDAPNHRKVHQTIVPRLGGLGIILAFLVVFCIRTLVPDDLWPRSGNYFSGALIFTALFLAVAGSLDDVRTLGFKTKFALQFTLATGVVVLLGHKFGAVSLFGHRVQLEQFGPILTIFWMVAVMNAFNIIDGIDGLAGGVAICGFGAVGCMAYANGDQYLLAMSVVFIGLCFGFLRFNFSKRHKVFLGDSGSQFLGATLALFAIEAQSLPNTRNSIFIPLLVVGYPLFDISVAMLRRFLKGSARGLGGRILRMFAADNEHLHHRLVFLGLSHMQSTFLLMLVASTLGAAAIIISRVQVWERVAVLTYFATALFLILNRLGYLGMRPWLTFPRSKAMPNNIVGVIEPDEVFFHSLKSFKQDKFDFLSMPAKLTKFMGDELVAVTLYNASSERFEEKWASALRASEYHDCPAIVIADAPDIERVKAHHPEGFKSIHFMEKPVRIPDLIRELEKCTQPRVKALARRPRERKFSLAQIALRNRARL